LGRCLEFGKVDLKERELLGEALVSFDTDTEALKASSNSHGAYLLEPALAAATPPMTVDQTPTRPTHIS
jgi:hypothetical protein